MKACLVIVTHNRLQYTIKCVQSVLNDTLSDYELYIWDNASNDGTQQYLASLKDARIKKIVYSHDNAGQTVAMNRCWTESGAQYVSKLDNDCLVTPGWMEVFKKAHEDVPLLGAIACWHFRQQDFNMNIAQHKVRRYGNHRIFQHPFVGGTGFLLKRSTFEKMGPWPEGSPDIGTTNYYKGMARKGFINGWYFPLILQDHMDDLYSIHSQYKDDQATQDIQKVTYSFRVNNIDTMSKRYARREKVLNNLLYSPYALAWHEGWRLRVRHRFPFLDKMAWRLRSFGKQNEPA